ncbi:MAG: alpha/beta hydrolase [Acidimicrobiia bacterium]|nr:alpha/beta hydrolase [Acidimicrobiia bacterium]
MSTTRTAEASDGRRLLLRSWEPTGPVRASVVILHGLGEHSGRYEHVGRAFADAGLAPIAVDFRGFGGSEGRRAFVKEFSEYLADVQVAMDEAAGRGLPVVLLGHSLGGLVALAYAQDREGVDYLVLSSPALDAAIPAPKRIAARVLRRILPKLTLANGITADQLSRDPSVGEAYFADPLVYTKTTAALGGAFLSAMAAARARKVPFPALVILGEQDTLVPPAFSAPLATRPGVDRVTFPDFHHESFNEEGGTTAIGVVIGWIDGQLAQRASG